MSLPVGFVLISSVSHPFRKRPILILSSIQSQAHPTELPLRNALIKSIRQGSFCDRGYLAKRDDSGKWRAPVYISSVVLRDTEPALNTCKPFFIQEHPHRTESSQVISDPRRNGVECSEDECDSDSDYENTPEGTQDSAREDTGSHSEQESKPGLTATLSAGAFQT